MTEITGGELLLRCLKQENVSHIFGVIDGSLNPLLEKLDEYDVQLIVPRHEAAGAHMADAWARVTRRPGVCMAGAGPGTANLVSGVVTAHAEGVPLVAISGQRRRNVIYPDRGGAFQYTDQSALFRPVTKWNATAHEWRRIPELVRQAFRVATSGRPGPVHLEFPEDVLDETGDADSVTLSPPEQYRLTTPSAGDPALIARAAHLLAEAERPLLHAGSGLAWAGGEEAFLALADYLAATMSVSLGARGTVPEDHPRYLHLLNREALEQAHAEADVVLAVGTRFGELEGWGRPPAWPPAGTQEVIHVDADPTSIGLNQPVSLGIVGDGAAVLSALLEAVKGLTGPREESAAWEEYRRLTAAWEADLEAQTRLGEGGINPGWMIQQVRAFFPRQAIFVMDGGNTSLWCANYNPVYAPRSYLYTAKFGHLGTGLPYALGAQVAAPDRPVYLVTGDGALGFSLQELETARRHGLPVAVVVNCDRRWGMEVSSQTMAFGGEKLVGVEHYPGVRYDVVAQGLGCHGELVEAAEQLLPALERARDAGRPAVIQVLVDQVANLIPPGLLLFGSMVFGRSD
ncbi:MAG: thiamine pyrophosphate-binding protein [Anaerolineae bacterium]|nr:MAG: thiamine pyrophosphate-binding protein [Anaerolineae bacterium]